MKQALDFIIIGAQKSGTTTLFELLKQHEMIFIPPEKELPFFGTKKEALGWQWYMQEYFHKATGAENKLWGTVTPQYMSSENFAEKLYGVCPGAKLIAILRNPFERAYSHYQMSLKRNHDTRSFSAAAKELLIPENTDAARKNPGENNAYFVWGEYGRILKSYLPYYTKANMLVLSMNELENNPEYVINKICSFLGIETFLPNNANKKFHQGGDKRKLPFINKIVKNQVLKNSYRKVFGNKSERTVKRWLYWLDQWNTKKSAKKSTQENEIYLKDLIELYAKDARILESEFGFQAPWKKYINS